jgi:hypothetical protein
MKSKIESYLSHLLFLLTLFSSYYIGVAFYNIATGLDFYKYSQNLYFFNTVDSEVYDSQGTLYFWSISKITGFTQTVISNQELSTLINNKLQFINFVYYLFGLLGLAVLLKTKKFSSKQILISFSILNFFPPSYYLRLTMKPEVMAFALLPWLFLFFELYIKKQTLFRTTFLALLLSITLTIKASITGMILLSLLILYGGEVMKLKSKNIFLLATTLLSSIIVYINYVLTNVWLFAQPNYIDDSLSNKWDNTAEFNFFVNVNLKNLYENPFKHLHADSFISITLIDTLSDYFTSFWKHEEDGNFFPNGTVEFTDNFLIQNFLQEYLSIIFTLLFYLLIIFFFLKKVENRKYFLLPFCGLATLIVNSFGFPVKNFDPETGDLFKVHYYSFLLCIAIVFLLTHLYKKYSYSYLLTILLIPIFLITIGFPKQLQDDTLNNLLIKIEYTSICFAVNSIYDIQCR